MSKYEMRYMFEWTSGVCLWANDEVTMEAFGSIPIFTADIPISDGLRERLESLILKHDTALNWDEPNAGLLWNSKQIAEFTEEAVCAYECLCKALGEEYHILFDSKWLI